jgi:hypothetical protein
MVGDLQISNPIKSVFPSSQWLTPHNVLMQRAEAGTVCANGPPQQCCNTDGACESNACLATCIALGGSCGSAGALCCEGRVCSDADTCVPFTCPAGGSCASCPWAPRKLGIDPDGVCPNGVTAQSTCGDDSCQAICQAVCGPGVYMENQCSNAGGFHVLLQQGMSGS